MKKILHIIDNFGQGAGAEHILFGVLNNLQGYDNYLLYFNKPDDLLEKLPPDIKVNYYPVSNKLDILKATFFLKQFIRENQIDIVHAHLTQSIIIAHLARIKTIPVIITYHAILFPKYKLGPIPTLPYLAYLLSYKKNQVSVGVSRSVLAELTEQYGITENKHCIFNFIDKKFLEFEPKEKKQEAVFKIICIGNIRPEKNFDLIFEAFDKEFKHNKNIELHIWGANRMPIDYQNILRSKGINNLFLKGSNNNIIELLPQYDLFISSSKYESFGLSVLEAMACNVPVLLSDIPAFKELYDGYATFFKSDSTIDFTEKLNNILTGKEDIVNKSKLAFLYSKKFSVQNTVKDLQVLYKDIL